MAPVLGCVADDFTGATDLANMLVRGGMRTVQLIGVPDAETDVSDVDAVVVALKSRTIDPGDAVRQSLAAMKWLQEKGCQRFFFKYCSTFDSTDKGNIGPVADAMLEALGGEIAIACPAFPETGRTIFKGHLFVGDQLLSDGPMRNHPLTPMTDSNLVSVLERQSKHAVGLVQFSAVAKGAAAISVTLETTFKDGKRFAIVDAVSDDQLYEIGEAVGDAALVTGGSGVALGLPAAYAKRGLLELQKTASDVPSIEGPAAVLAGSCSAATLGQISTWEKSNPAYNIDVLGLANGKDEVATALAFAREHAPNPVLIYASAPPEAVADIQSRLGREAAGEMVEAAMAKIAKALVEVDGVRRLVVAGGETSGAVVSALGVKGLRIGKQIDPGVPGTVTIGGHELALALKSGNFGGPDFFGKALREMA